MTTPHKFSMKHYFIPGTERPLCAAQTGNAAYVPEDVSCPRCTEIIGNLWRWRLVATRADSAAWIEDVDNIAVCHAQGNVVEVRTRTPDTIRNARKRLQAEAYPITICHTVAVIYRHTNWPCRMMALRGPAAKAALALCSLNIQRSEAA